jgi:AcrR family transcriptional regulator
VETPWGEIEALRERRTPAGAGRAAQKRDQRQRLFAAMVACCDDKGYDATAVADLLDGSGLARGTFYANFEDKRDCFVAAEEEIVRMTIVVLQRGLGAAGDPEAQARSGFEAFVDLVVAQPAAARMCLVESFAAGDSGVRPIRRAIGRFVELGHESLLRLPGREGMPIELTQAIVAGFYQVIYNRIHSRREEELPDLVAPLWEWAMSYMPPPDTLRGPTRRPGREGIGSMPPFAAFSPEQRIIRAFAAVTAEHGYPATTVADVCAAASVSLATFYQHFTDKADLLEAALDSSGAQLLAASMPSARRAPNWQAATRAAIEASCGFLAAEPAFAKLRIVDVYSAGPAAIAMRDAAGTELLGALVAPILAERPELPEIAAEATLGAILGVLYERIEAGGATRLHEAAPLLTFLVLSPLLGTEAAFEVATARPGVAKPSERMS